LKAYTFDESLEEGLILERPNRFIMMVRKGGKTYRCHCPSTGSIGGIVFKNNPCLMSPAKTKERSTAYTIEAISLDPLKKKNKSWLGINQVKVNSYVEHFLRTDQLTKMIKGGSAVERERKLGKSRIDFKVGKHYLEVKMPLISLPTTTQTIKKVSNNYDSFDRLIKHFRDLGKSLKGNSRALIILCYVYDAKPFRPPKIDATNAKIIKAARAAQRRGLENWQINMKLTPRGVTLRKCFPLQLFENGKGKNR